MRPVFVIDINKCVGCRACVAACIVEHGQPFVASANIAAGLPRFTNTRTYVSWVERENGDRPTRRFISHLCFHCEKTPCLEVCPTQATYKTPEGVVLVDKDKCVGCRYCIMACPYGMRFMPPAYDFLKAEKNPVVKDAKAGTEYGGVMFKPPVPNKWATKLTAVDKCTLCYHRYNGDGKIWTPACVETCPTGSRMFGDLDDPNDPVADLVRRGVARHAEPAKGTRGLVYYVGL
ncbi:MAG: 4Fe-4S dicluster domain-containing protein [Pyrobaculum sp.]